MIVSLCTKFFGVFFAVVLILRIPSFPKLSSSSSSQQTLTTTHGAVTSDGSSSFFNHHHVNDEQAASAKGGEYDDDDDSTTLLTEQGEAIAASSAFDRDLYHTLLVEPYRSQYACQPRGIHLSQFHDVVVHNNKDEENDNSIPDDDDDDNNDNINSENDNNNDYRVSVTVSFLLTSRRTQSAAATACGSALAAVVYGRYGESKPEGIQLSQAPTSPVQFNYTSLLSLGRLYTSDYIHHITIPHLKAGMERYWYRIIVLSIQDDDDEKVNIAATTTTSRRLGDHALRARVVKAAAAEMNSDTPLLYKLGIKDHQILGKTEDHHFWTPPMPGSPTTLALVGDLGQTINSTKTMAYILQASLDPRGRSTAISNLLIAGDLSYADTDPYRWTSWFNLMEPLLRTTLLSTAAGNHEIETDIMNGHEFVPYEHYFRNPNRITNKSESFASSDSSSSFLADAAAPYNYGNSFYSYQHGLARIIVLNSYSDTTVGSVQYIWLVEELKRHAQTRHNNSSSSASSSKKKNTQPWLIVAFHSPLYTTFLGHVHESQARRMKTAMEPLFVKYGVNLVISGHDHGYMRTHSIRPSSKTTTMTNGTDEGNDYDSMDNAQIDPTGLSPIYLTLGSAGNREHHAPGYRNPHKQEEWVVARDLCDYGYGHLHLKNATHARLRWIRDHIVPDNMTISDDVWIVNHHHYHYRQNDVDAAMNHHQHHHAGGEPLVKSS